jgi:hypothetical protein
MFFQLPKRSGRSRHGAPERNFQITASTKSRLPNSLLRPTCPGRPGSKWQLPTPLMGSDFAMSALLKPGC